MTLQRFVSFCVIPGLLAGLFIAQTTRFQVTTSATYDEPLYLELAHQLYRTGSYDGFVRTMVPPVPILVVGLPLFLITDGPVPADSTTWRDQLQILRATNSCLVGVPLIWLIFAWASARTGVLIGTFVATLAALSPNVVAHSAVATMDASVALFFSLATLAITRHADQPTVWRFAVMATAIGIAMACKQSAVCLAPVAALTAGLGRWKRNPGTSVAGRMTGAGLKWVSHTIVILVWAFTVNWALYGFTVAPLLKPGLAHPTFVKVLGTGPEAARIKHLLETVPMPVSVVTFLGQVAHGIRGHETYVLGHIFQFAPWYYFPLAVGCKCTAPELILIVGVFVYLAVWWRRWWGNAVVHTLVLAAGLFLVTCLTSKLALGVRYLAPVYAIFLIIAADAIGRAWQAVPKVAATAGFALLTMQVVAAITAGPHYMSYFNRLVGGPASGHRFLGDSNLDWGQDLAGVPAEIERLGGRRPCLAYFGMVDPKAYGVWAVDWRDKDQDIVLRCDLVVVSVSLMQGLEYGPGVFDDFWQLKPVGGVGHGIRIYDLTDPDVRAALLRARERHLLRN